MLVWASSMPPLPSSRDGRWGGEDGTEGTTVRLRNLARAPELRADLHQDRAVAPRLTRVRLLVMIGPQYQVPGRQQDLNTSPARADTEATQVATDLSGSSMLVSSLSVPARSLPPERAAPQSDPFARQKVAGAGRRSFSFPPTRVIVGRLVRLCG